MQAVLYHNVRQYDKEIEMIEKFLKIVIYLADEKSIELGLNVMAAAYMQIGDISSYYFINIRGYLSA